ncbi:MAG TPA: class I SAM-dependent methyltransferase [Burkholderiales bacterium]|nr:class I SAM-dependent methyltransferase [Burkholderiales bacterium]
MRAFAVVVLSLLSGAVAAQDDWRVPFITTPDEVVERMLQLAGTRADDFVVDLGSGDGRIVITAARKFGARGLGIELDAKLVEASRENARHAAVSDRARFVQGDVLLANFSQASVVTVYLLPDLIGRLQARFVDELRPGTRIVSHAFRMTGWRPERSETMRIAQPHFGQGDESTLYLWVVPANVRGVWAGEGRRMRIEQNYQELDIEGATQARILGTEVSWLWPEGRFSGRVEPGRIAGELAGKPLVLVRER